MTPDLHNWLLHNAYVKIKEFPDGRIAATTALIFHGSMHIMRSEESAWIQWDEKYCFTSLEAANRALENWDGTGEPEGWHRHVPSNRRREDGDPAKELIWA